MAELADWRLFEALSESKLTETTLDELAFRESSFRPKFSLLIDGNDDDDDDVWRLLIGEAEMEEVTFGLFLSLLEPMLLSAGGELKLAR